MTTSLQIEEHQGVKVLRMISQDGTNRLTSEFVASLTEAITKLTKEERGLVITGNDRFFSAGADLEQIAALDGPSAYEFAKMGQRLMQAVEDFPAPLYAAISGYCMGGGDTSDLPGGALNIVTGYTSQLLKPLAEHDDVDAIWCFGDEASAAAAKAMSIGNLKQVWTNEGRAIDWFNPKLAEGRWFLEHATQVKNIWVPYGE